MRFWGDLVCTASALGLEGGVNGGVGAVVGEDERRGRESWLKMAQELPLRQSKHFLFRDVTSEGYRASLRFNALSQPFNHECVCAVQSKKVEMTTERSSCFYWPTTNSFEFYRYIFHTSVPWSKCHCIQVWYFILYRCILQEHYTNCAFYWTNLGGR